MSEMFVDFVFKQIKKKKLRLRCQICGFTLKKLKLRSKIKVKASN